MANYHYPIGWEGSELVLLAWGASTSGCFH